jgi:hypothetical protein
MLLRIEVHGKTAILTGRLMIDRVTDTLTCLGPVIVKLKGKVLTDNARRQTWIPHFHLPDKGIQSDRPEDEHTMNFLA